MTNPNPTPVAPSGAERHARTRQVLVTLGLPVLLALVGVLLMLSWLPELPDPVAIHFGFDGTPDGFGPVWLTILLLPLLQLGFAAFCTVAVLGGIDRAQGGDAARPSSPAAALGGGAGLGGGRFWPAMSVGFAVFLGVVLAGTLYLQRGVADPTTLDGSSLPWLLLLLAPLAAVALGVVAWFLTPRLDPAADPLGGEAPALDLAPGELGYWRSAALTSWPVQVFPAIAVVGALVVTVLVGVPLWFTLVLLVVLLVPLSTLLPWTVTADTRGLRVTSALGLLRFRTPLESIEGASVVDVRPVPDFGGWGLRAGRGGWGVITRKGEALQIVRAGKGPFVVTVEDAATGAAVLNGLRAR